MDGVNLAQRFQGFLVIWLSLPKYISLELPLGHYLTHKIDRYWYYWYQSFAVTLVRPTGCRRPQWMAFVGRCDPQLCSVMNHWQLDRVETLASLRKDSFPRLEAPGTQISASETAFCRSSHPSNLVHPRRR